MLMMMMSMPALLLLLLVSPTPLQGVATSSLQLLRGANGTPPTLPNQDVAMTTTTRQLQTTPEPPSSSSLRKTLGNQRLVNPDGSDLVEVDDVDQCGIDVSIDGAMAVVGCPGTNGSVGAVQVYERRTSGGSTSWKLTATIQPTTVSLLGLFGANVALRNGVIVVGSFTNSVTASGDGSAFVYERNSTSGEWEETVLNVEQPLRGDQFGRDVAVSEDGQVLAVAAVLADAAGVEDAGTVTIFEKVNGEWAFQTTLVAEMPVTLSGFGASLGLSGRTLVVGAFGISNGQGKAIVFDQDADGHWTQTATLTPDDGDMDDAFGNAVDIYQDRIVVGALNQDNGAATDAGAVYVFDREQPSGKWSLTAKLTQGEPASNDRFGQSVAVYEDDIAVGLIGADLFQTNGGAVYIFKRQADGRYVESAVLGTTQNNLVGITVGFSDTDLIVGAPAGVRGSAFVEPRATLVDTCVPQVTGFKVIDVRDQTETPLSFVLNLENFGGVVDIRADVDNCGQDRPSFRCVKLERGSRSRNERYPPYNLFNATGGVPHAGFDILRACLYDDTSCSVGRKGCLDLDTYVQTCTPRIESLILYDANTDQALETISDGGEYCIPVGGFISIQAVAQCVEYVEFAFRGDGRADDRVESSAPYFLYGDQGTDVRRHPQKKPVVPGLYALRARYIPANPFLGRGTVLQQRFTLKDCGPTAAPTAAPSFSNATLTLPPIGGNTTSAPSLSTVNATTPSPTLIPTRSPTLSPTRSPTLSPTATTSNPTVKPTTPKVTTNSPVTPTPKSSSPTSNVKSYSPTSRVA